MNISRDYHLIADVVRKHRKSAGLSQRELAELAGVGKTVVFDIEKGKITIKLLTLFTVFRALNIQCVLTSPLISSSQIGGVE